MKTVVSALFAGALLFGAPIAMAQDIIIAPEAGMKFQEEVKVKKIQSMKHEGDLKVGVVIPAEVEFYDVPETVVVATPTLKGHKYVYLNDRVYVVEPSSRKIVAVVN